jgi:hypothetical protein
VGNNPHRIQKTYPSIVGLRGKIRLLAVRLMSRLPPDERIGGFFFL